jgi:hypothetical protein
MYSIIKDLGINIVSYGNIDFFIVVKHQGKFEIGTGYGGGKSDFTKKCKVVILCSKFENRRHHVHGVPKFQKGVGKVKI